ncbi:neural cell adhesion molecule 1-like [Argopecten irradians]|uniref:neural cell adhesion molecule 1-like n=1 Tax=Argopecten irradians TaxID=31199 RepID=UPI003714C764
MSDRDVLLKSSDSAPVIQSYTTFTTNATIVVTFISRSDSEVEWYKDQHLLPASHDVTIDTERYIDKDENEASTFKAILSRSPPIEPVYGNYKCIIRNDAGITELYIDLDFPNTELPILLSTPSTVEMNDDVITVSIHFDSNIAHPTISWYHNNVQVEASEQYRLTLDWNGMNSSDWLSSGYPLSESLLNISDTYQYPTLGSDRTSTHPNANYKATLTISKFTSEHFGSYRLFLKNLVGTTSHVIDISMPEVFPYATCDQGETIQLVCNVTSCSDVSLSWIHSVDDVVIRKLPGNQDGTINTLTIPTCMYSDAGIYTCVGTDKETGSAVVINHDKTTLTVRSIAVLLEPNVTIESRRILIEVPFFAKPSAHRITWYRNGERISPSKDDVIETEQRYVDAPVHGTINQFSGHMTSISVFSFTAQSFGRYKVTIMNEIGSSEQYIDVKNPMYANPVIFSDTRVTYDAGSALLSMTFTSYYPESCVKWYLRGIEVGENHPADKYVIQTNSSNQVIDSDQSVRKKVAMSSILTVTCLTEEDYGIYEAVISNHAGKTVIPVRLAEHRLAIPELVSELLTNRTNSTVTLSGSFLSTSGYRKIKWFKGDIELTNITSKYDVINEATDIEISTNGETVVKSGFITRLRVTSLTDQDYGLYRVQIYNEFGMTDSSVMLDKECT